VSLAIDAGVCAPTYMDAITAMSVTVTTDQRATPRPHPVGGNCDIGAFEYTPVVPAVAGNYRAGTGGQSLRIAGTGFQRGSLIRVDSVTLPAGAVTGIADDGTNITVTLPAHTAGVVTLAILNPGNLTSPALSNLTVAMPATQPIPAATAAPTGVPGIAPTAHPMAPTVTPPPLAQPGRR